MGIDPNLDDMEAHLALLYDWTHTQYSDALFETRCIHPNGKVRDKRFTCTPEGYQQALYYAVKHNDTGYNVYVTVNVLKPNTTQTATDDDVEVTIFHFLDADGVDDPDLISERSQGFKPTFTTLTGTIPQPRSQVYWRMSHPITDMVKWRTTQAALAQHFGTDNTVKNPSRVLRLAGTISHPPERKRKRGYIVEVTALDRAGNSEVCPQSFAASFPYTEPASEPPEPVSYQPVTDDGNGKLPLCVIEAALQAIPPISGEGQRDLWLDVAQACRDAHPDSFPLFDQWQRQSNRYEKSDSKVWATLKPPSPGSYKSLLAHAKRADQIWWRHHSGEVYDWGCQQAAMLHALQSKTDDRGDTAQEDNEHQHAAPFYGLRLRDVSLEVEPRQWVYGTSLIRGMLSVLGGSGGEGKSAYSMTVLVSIATGRPLLAAAKDDPAHHIYEPRGTVMYYSLEDPMSDLIRQVKGIMQHHNINSRSISTNLILQSGRNLPLVVAKQDERGKLIRCDIQPIVDYLVANNVVALTVDPYANSFDGGDGAESGSDTMKIICDQWRQVAHKANCAIWLIHHFRKGGAAGEADAFRGSTTLQNAARIMETLTTMTRDEAKALSVDETERRRFKRLENAKANLGPASEGRWYRFNADVSLGIRWCVDPLDAITGSLDVGIGQWGAEPDQHRRLFVIAQCR
jgi:AAA domain/RepB DNA-primase from phage plasmid/Primase C terminal 2 (PriCT-2)